MRIRNTEERKRRWERLKRATGENTVAGALDVAAKHYVSDLETKRDLVEDLSPEVAAELSTPQLPVHVERVESVGPDETP